MSRRSVSGPLGILAGVALAVVVLGCGGGGGGGGSDSGLPERVTVTSLRFPGVGPTEGSVRGADVFPFLRFTAPILVTHVPGDADRLFVLEQGGRISIVHGTGAGATRTTFLDLTPVVTQEGGEAGLLGLAFDPAYGTNRRFYVSYVSRGLPRHLVVARYERSASDPDVADSTETTLLSVEKDFSSHNGGMLAVGPDGLLYASLGDGGSAGDPSNHALDPTSLLGKMLRIDPSGSTDGLPYAIPADNPFAGSSNGERRELYAWGLRNPWRFGFDRTTGALWLGDVGQDTREEIDLIRRGGNYGWRAKEGNLTYSPNDLAAGPFDAPVIDYDHNLVGASVIGGYVYRGPSMPDLYGSYLYADHQTGRLWALVWDGSQVVSNVQVATIPSVSSFGEDDAGNLYVCEYDEGRILKLETLVPAPTEFPDLLSETGIFANLATLTPAPGILPYDVNSPLWSDHAMKDRLLALPGDESIAWSRDSAWAFPLGTCLVKTFRLPLVRGDAASAVRVETRVLLRTTSGWQGFSYRWREDGSDADLLPDSDTRTLTISDPDAPGGTVQQTWSFPSRGQCLQCHTASAGRVLGLSTRQSNRTFDYTPLGGMAANQLATWAHLGIVSGLSGAPASLPAFPSPADATAPVADRARAYLDANCAICHRPGGSTGSTMDLRATTALGAMGIVGVVPSQGGLGLPDPKIVAPGNPSGSVLWLRMKDLGSPRMPSLSSSELDEEGSDLVSDWIVQGP